LDYIYRSQKYTLKSDLLFDLCRFWTRRQLGTYSNHRPPVTVLISRWISVFLILHNLTAIASYAAVVASRVGQDPEVCFQLKLFNLDTKSYTDSLIIIKIHNVPKYYWRSLFLMTWKKKFFCEFLVFGHQEKLK
jgi:hypothetical protein